MVGAVIVNNNKIIGEGFHQHFGGNHAEENAINSIDDKKLLNNSSLYVNLEPCCHWGKRPPCTRLIINSGIKKVIIGNKDPNPLMNGKNAQKFGSKKFLIAPIKIDRKTNKVRKCKIGSQKLARFFN